MPIAVSSATPVNAQFTQNVQPETQKLNVQTGQAPDKHGWMHTLV